MAKDDFENGVWRTVGGRRIFIRDGEDLSSAMKRSGKFKRKKDIEHQKRKINNELAGLTGEDKKRADEEFDAYDKLSKMSDEELKGEMYHNTNMLNEMERRLSSRYNLSDEQREKLEDRASNYEARRDELKSELESRKNGKEKELSFNEKREYLKERGIDALNNFTDDDDDTFIRKQYEKESSKEKYNEERDKNYQEYMSGKKDWEGYQQGVQKLKDKLSGNKEEDEATTVKNQMSELEKASGSKVKDAFQTDLFGNGKENRFILDDGTIVAHTLESFGQKEDTWSVGDKTFKSYDDVKDYLSGGTKNNTELKKGDTYINKMGTKVDIIDVDDKGQTLHKFTRADGSTDYKNYNKSNVESMLKHNEYVKTDNLKDYDVSYKDSKGKISKVRIQAENEELAKHTARNFTANPDKTPNEIMNVKKHLSESEDKSNNTPGSRLKAYSKAFEEYKKKHPNTKLTINQFVKYSEGKK